jgi:hypothetical protein
LPPIATTPFIPPIPPPTINFPTVTGTRGAEAEVSIVSRPRSVKASEHNGVVALPTTTLLAIATLYTGVQITDRVHGRLSPRASSVVEASIEHTIDKVLNIDIDKILNILVVTHYFPYSVQEVSKPRISLSCAGAYQQHQQ